MIDYSGAAGHLAALALSTSDPGSLLIIGEAIKEIAKANHGVQELLKKYSELRQQNEAFRGKN